jgi:hypothetical protein
VLDGDREVGVGAYRAAVDATGQDLVAAVRRLEDPAGDAQFKGVHTVDGQNDDSVNGGHGVIPSKVGIHARISDGDGNTLDA